MTVSIPPAAARSSARQRLKIRVSGTVQGVGFRPFVYRRATALGLAGWVANSRQGVVLEAEGEPAGLADLLNALRDAPPANARVTAIDAQEIATSGEAGFTVRRSAQGDGPSTSVLPDQATCAQCLAELFDAADRRYLYPFINCIDCGPRYSIVEDLPYDRERTSMRGFAMCPDCLREYDDPADRRFHAEPNACPACGPRLSLWDSSGHAVARDHGALSAAVEALRSGRIVAVKGLGGFHLMADARNDAAIRALRTRKGREEKPFAVMFPALADLQACCDVDPAEEALLTGPARPIVLLRRKAFQIAPSVAPGNPLIGAMLPYTPLHHLLMRAFGFALVATSGNVSDEPIVTDERDALGRLAGIADLFLVHDRPILRPVDDSVLRVICGRALMLRRARGYAPAPVACPEASPGIIALGGHLKTTIALSGAGSIVLGPHIGDLETLEARSAHARMVQDMKHLYTDQVRLIARDLHPDYASRRAVEALNVPVLDVQHHLAHVVSCMAENGVAPPVLGVAWDGAGYGPDGTLWGGEFLRVDEAGWRRVAHLRPFRLPGGEIAMREPRRAALGLLYAAFGSRIWTMTDLPPLAAFSPAERNVLSAMLARGVNAPVTSSMGRLFDAVAALCGLRQRASYEGQAASELEAAHTEEAFSQPYEFHLRDGAGEGALTVDWQPALEALLGDIAARVPVGTISRAFHSGLAHAIVAMATRIGQRRVVLTGGCFQNARLTQATVDALRQGGFEPVWHRHVPPNDGGLALGQAAWAVWRLQRGDRPCA